MGWQLAAGRDRDQEGRGGGRGGSGNHNGITAALEPSEAHSHPLSLLKPTHTSDFLFANLYPPPYTHTHTCSTTSLPYPPAFPSVQHR